MFLGLLSEDNKRRFLELCVHSSNADGIFDEKEKDMVYAYCREMNIPEGIPETSKHLDEIINEIYNDSDSKEKRIIIFELLGLMLADENFANEEKDMLQSLCNKFEISDNELSKIISLLEIYKKVYDEIYFAVCM